MELNIKYFHTQTPIEKKKVRKKQRRWNVSDNDHSETPLEHHYVDAEEWED